jgi:chromatin segregation and condensation protein Rec8/ScpA/Scc1 (kleisin family)
VVDQYLAHRERRLTLDDAGEYLYAAAALIEWKTRLLLPSDPSLAEADPRVEIVRALDRGTASQQSPEPVPEAEAEGPAGLSLLDLMLLLHGVEQFAAPPAHVIPHTEVTVRDQLRWLLAHLARLPRELQDTEAWFALHASLPAKISLFLALLELAKQGQFRLEQRFPFGPIAALPA